MSQYNISLLQQQLTFTQIISHWAFPRCSKKKKKKKHTTMDHNMDNYTTTFGANLLTAYNVFLLSFFLSINSKYNSWNNAGKLQSHYQTGLFFKCLHINVRHKVWISLPLHAGYWISCLSRHSINRLPFIINNFEYNQLCGGFFFPAFFSKLWDDAYSLMVSWSRLPSAHRGRSTVCLHFVSVQRAKAMLKNTNSRALSPVLC